jgi:protein-disulfide isomerase
MVESTAFAECLESRKYQGALVRDSQEGKRLGVQGTPTFFINGRMREGELPLAVLQDLIERELRAKVKS